MIRCMEDLSYGNMLTVVIVPPGGSGRTCSGLAIPKGGLTKKKKKKKDGEGLFIGECSDRTRWLGRNFAQGGEALKQAAQRSCGCPIHGDIQGQVGCGVGKPELVESLPAHGRGVGTQFSLRSLSTQTIL